MVWRGSADQIVKPLGLSGGERDGVIAGPPRQNEPRSSSHWFTDRLPSEPDEPPFCLRIVFDNSALEETSHPGGGDTGFGGGMVEPLPDIEGQSTPFEVIEHRPSEPFAEPFRRLALSVLMQQVVLRKALKLRPEDAQTMGSRLEANRTVGRGGEAMPEGRLNEVCCDQLPHPLQRVHRFLDRLRGAAVHEVSKDENACVFEGRRHKRGVIDGNPFLDLLQQPVRGRLESRRHRDATGGRQEAAEVRRKCFFKADIAPPGYGDAPFQ